jgi:hypothetical protein
MTLANKLAFAVFFLGLAVWNLFSWMAVVRPETVARLWPGASPRLMRLMGVLFLVAGLAFCAFALAQLAAGTFKWKGDTRTYGFSDFIR